MGERRKHTSFWGSEDEIEHFSGIRDHNSWMEKDRHRSHGDGCYQEFPDSRTTISQKSRDQSGWQSWESIEEHPTAPINSSFKNTPEGKEINGGRRYQKHVSPFSDGGELHSYDHAHEYDRNPPQRNRGRGWNRSRSRSRTRGRRTQSRSLSRGREMVRVRGWRRRSRSRRGGNAYDKRSRSPIGHYRRQSYEWSDKTSGCEKSSQTCRYFTSGGCRRGRECRFFHPNSMSHGDDDLVPDGTVESWRSKSDNSHRRSKSDYSHISKQRYSSSGFESQIDASDPYYRENDQFPNKSRCSAPCKDFMRGNCRWGETCRFPHHVAPADSFGQGTRNTSFNKNFNHQVHKSGKPLCKYFAAGECDRDNCRFSHEDPNLNNQQGRKDKLTDNCSSHDKSNWCDTPKWNDAMRTNDTPKPTGWGESIVTNTVSTGDTGNRQNSDKWLPWGHNFKSGNKNCGIKDRPSNSSNEEKEPSLPRESGSYAGNTGNRQNGDRWEPWDHNSETESKKWGVQEVTSSSLNCEKQSSLTGKSGSSLNCEKQSSLTGKSSAGYAGDTGSGQNNDGWEPWGNNFENENKKWGVQERTGNSLNSDKRSALPGESGSYGGDMGLSESIAEDIITNKQEQLQGSQLQNQDGVSNLHELNCSQENQSFSVKSLQQNVYPASHIVNENNLMNSFGSDVLAEVKDGRFTNHPTLLSGQINQDGIITLPGHSSISNESERVQNMLYTNSSNGIDTDLNGSEMHVVDPLNVQSNTRSTLKVAQSQEFLQAKVPHSLSNLLTSKHSDQVTNSQVATADEQLSPETNPVSFTLRSVNKQSQSSAGMDVSDSSGMLHSFLSTTGYLPQVNTTNVQANPAAASLDLLGSMENNLEGSEHDNRNLAHGMELNNQMQFSSSIVGTEFDGSKPKPPESLRKQEEVVANLGVTKAMGEESKGIQENKPFETVDVHLKPEEQSDNKDEKVMRVFKNALIEFVKEVLKPTWKDGRMTREAYRTVVKKVVDKVSSTIQVDQVPKTRDQVEQYLSYSKPKITKLIQAYMERCQKPDA